MPDYQQIERKLRDLADEVASTAGTALDLSNMYPRVLTVLNEISGNAPLLAEDGVSKAIDLARRYFGAGSLPTEHSERAQLRAQLRDSLDALADRARKKATKENARARR